MLEVLDVDVRARIDAALVAVLPAHDVRGAAVLAQHLDDLAVLRRVTDEVALHEQPVAGRCPKRGVRLEAHPDSPQLDACTVRAKSISRRSSGNTARMSVTSPS